MRSAGLCPTLESALKFTSDTKHQDTRLFAAGDGLTTPVEQATPVPDSDGAVHDALKNSSQQHISSVLVSTTFHKAQVFVA